VTAGPDRTSAVFAALADPTRRRVVESLSQAGESTATELASGMPVTRQAVTKHLQALADAGLVTTRREGREVRYRLTPSPMRGAVRWMATVGAEWDDRLEALRSELRRH
jgi:DNA-binding transcriptional ArsR family regulator